MKKVKNQVASGDESQFFEDGKQLCLPGSSLEQEETKSGQVWNCKDKVGAMMCCFKMSSILFSLSIRLIYFKVTIPFNISINYYLTLLTKSTG